MKGSEIYAEFRKKIKEMCDNFLHFFPAKQISAKCCCLRTEWKITTETTVGNVYCLFPYIHDALQLTTYFFLSPNPRIRHKNAIQRQKTLVKLGIVTF